MKKIFYSLAVLLLATSTHAQVNSATFRLLGGLSLPKYKYELSGAASSRDVYTGISGALMLSFYSQNNYSNASNNISLGGHLAFNYSQKGAINKNLYNAGQLEAQNRITYLQGDALGSIGFGKNRRKGTFIDFCAGPYLAYAINGRQQIKMSDGTSVNTDFKFGTGATDDFINFDLGLKTGLLVTLSSRFSIAAMYEYGLSDIAPQDAVKVQNRDFLITAGINFGYKKK